MKVSFSCNGWAGGGPRVLLALVATVFAVLGAVAKPAQGVAATKKGGAKADSLVGTAGADRLLGAGGADALSGKAGPDTLVGGPGDDRLTGGPGPDTMLGGAGSDLLLAKDGSADNVDCGAGPSDVAVVDAADRVSGNCEEIAGDVSDVPSVSQPAPGPAPAPSAASPSAPQPPEPPPSEEESEGEFEEQPLAMFPDGHGWTGNGMGTFGDVGPPLVVNNDRSFRITTDGSGDGSVATSPLLSPVDLSGSHVTVQGQVGFGARLGAVKLRLASGNIDTDYAEATVWESDLDPIILRSSFEFQSLPVKGFHVVGNVDWSKIDRAQIVVTDNGAGSAAFYVAGIYAVPTSQQATISFAFDDGYQSVFTRGVRKLSAYRYPASAYVIADVVGDPGELNLQQLYNLRDLHHWEIGGHSFTLASHNLADGLDDLEPEALKAEMDGLRDWLDEYGFSRASFAYPKGAAGPEVRKFVSRDYCSARATAKGPETIPPRDNYTLRGWSVNGLNTDVEAIDDQIDKAIAEGTWLILTFHDIVGGAPGVGTEFSDDDFDEVVDYVRARQNEGDLRVRTVGAVAGQGC